MFHNAWNPLEDGTPETAFGRGLPWQTKIESETFIPRKKSVPEKSCSIVTVHSYIVGFFVWEM